MNSSKILSTNEIKSIVEDVWKRLLKRDMVESRDDFFLLGGTSLSALKFLIEIEDIFGENILTPEQLYRGSTFREVVSTISSRKGIAAEPSTQ